MSAGAFAICCFLPQITCCLTSLCGLLTLELEDKRELEEFKQRIRCNGHDPWCPRNNDNPVYNLPCAVSSGSGEIIRKAPRRGKDGYIKVQKKQNCVSVNLGANLSRL